MPSTAASRKRKIAARNRASKASQASRDSTMVDASDLSSVSQLQSTVHPYNDPPQTPERPSTKQKPGLPKVTARQKEALIENLKFEIAERARKMRAQYELQAQGLRSRIEMRIHRIPRNLRTKTMLELMEQSAKNLNDNLANRHNSPEKENSPIRISPAKTAHQQPLQLHRSPARNPLSPVKPSNTLPSSLSPLKPAAVAATRPFPKAPAPRPTRTKPAPPTLPPSASPPSDPESASKSSDDEGTVIHRKPSTTRLKTYKSTTTISTTTAGASRAPKRSTRASTAAATLTSTSNTATTTTATRKAPSGTKSAGTAASTRAGVTKSTVLKRVPSGAATAAAKKAAAGAGAGTTTKTGLPVAGGIGARAGIGAAAGARGKAKPVTVVVEEQPVRRTLRARRPTNM